MKGSPPTPFYSRRDQTEPLVVSRRVQRCIVGMAPPIYSVRLATTLDARTFTSSGCSVADAHEAAHRRMLAHVKKHSVVCMEMSPL